MKSFLIKVIALAISGSIFIISIIMLAGVNMANQTADTNWVTDILSLFPFVIMYFGYKTYFYITLRFNGEL